MYPFLKAESTMDASLNLVNCEIGWFFLLPKKVKYCYIFGNFFD